MITVIELPKYFSGVAEFKTVSAVYIKHFFNGELHREDGPAVLFDGKPHQWWVNGRQYSEEEYGHFLEKKALKEKLESKLAEKGSSKRGKI